MSSESLESDQKTPWSHPAATYLLIDIHDLILKSSATNTHHTLRTLSFIFFQNSF